MLIWSLLPISCASTKPLVNRTAEMEVRRAFDAVESAIVAQDFDAWWSMLSTDYIDFYSRSENYPDGYGIDDLSDWFYTMKVEIREKYNDSKALRADYTVLASADAAVVYSVLASMAEMGWKPKPAAFFILERGHWRYGTEREVRAAGWRPSPTGKARLEGAPD